MIYNLTLRLNKINFQENLYCIKRLYHKNTYNILFFGSDSIALSSFRKINELRKSQKIIGRLDLVTVGNLKSRNVIIKYAQTENLQTRSWPLHNLRPEEYDIGLIVAFGHLIKDDVLEKFPMGMVNVHPSLLPRWRGAAPIIHTLLHGDKITGVSLMKIKANVFDVGEIISQRKVSVPEDMRLPELTEQLSEIGADMLVDCVRNLPKSLENSRPQGEEGVTYAKKITKSISEVRWSEMSSVDVYNLYRATYGLYPLTTRFRDKKMKLFDVFLNKEEEVNTNCPVGTIEYCKETNAVKVLCKDRRYIYLRSLRLVGKKQISALDFFNGYINPLPVSQPSAKLRLS